MTELKKVAVTGANGYIASQLIKALLEKGLTVHCTVRSLDKLKEKSAHLIELDPKGKRLKFFEADLLDDGSFKECFQGVDGVFHTASPFFFQSNEPQKQLIDPAVKGTNNVVREALKSPTVKRLVVTSSVASIQHHNKQPGEPFTEDDWNTTSTIDKEPYQLSKVSAEKKAWELVEDKELNKHNVRMTTVNPSLVLGPQLSKRTDSTSIALIKSLLDNSSEYVPKMQLCCTHVLDVVDTHIHAMFDDNAKGRYIISDRDSVTFQQIAEWLKVKYSHVNTKVPSDGEYNPQPAFDNTKVQRDFNMKLRDMKQGVLDMADRLFELGLIKS